MEQPKEAKAEDKETPTEKKSSVKDKLKNEKKDKVGKESRKSKKDLQESIG